MKALLLADRRPDTPLADLLREAHPDLVLCLGDLNRQLLGPLHDWAGPKLGVHGNHCCRGYMEDLGIIDLHLKVVELAGLRFGGLEGSLRYKPVGSEFLYEQDEMQEIARQLPPVDVLVCHSPPFGVNDDRHDLAHTGFIGLLQYVLAHSPAYLLHGHTYPSPEELVSLVDDTVIVYANGHKIIELG